MLANRGQKVDPGRPGDANRAQPMSEFLQRTPGSYKHEWTAMLCREAPNLPGTLVLKKKSWQNSYLIQI